MRTVFRMAAVQGGGPFHDSPDGRTGRRNRRTVEASGALSSGRRHRDDPFRRVVWTCARRLERAARLEIAPAKRAPDAMEDEAHAMLLANFLDTKKVNVLRKRMLECAGHARDAGHSDGEGRLRLTEEKLLARFPLVSD